MSILSNAEQIRVETITGANTALRVGGNLVEIANDLVIKASAITANASSAATANSTATTAASSAATANTAATAAGSTAAAAATAAATANSSSTTNATAILTKLGKSTSTIPLSEVDVLTAAAYTALATKVATKLYFTT